jgi:hypothetical protein
MARKERSTDPAEIQLAIEEAIQDIARKGLVVDSGQGRWSQRTGRYEIVWESTGFGKRSTKRHAQKSIGDRANVGCNYNLS